MISNKAPLIKIQIYLNKVLKPLLLGYHYKYIIGTYFVLMLPCSWELVPEVVLVSSQFPKEQYLGVEGGVFYVSLTANAILHISTQTKLNKFVVTLLLTISITYTARVSSS